MGNYEEFSVYCISFGFGPGRCMCPLVEPIVSSPLSAPPKIGRVIFCDYVNLFENSESLFFVRSQLYRLYTPLKLAYVLRRHRKKKTQSTQGFLNRFYSFPATKYISNCRNFFTFILFRIASLFQALQKE